LPFTKKPVSARMGKGKGAWKGFNVFLRRGTFLLEIGNIKTIYILLALKEIAEKLPVKIKIVKKKN
jgi:ribosomal protein L16/L10AE